MCSNPQNYIYQHLHNSYNKFLEEDIPKFLNQESIFTEIMTSPPTRHRFKFSNIHIVKIPQIKFPNTPTTPTAKTPPKSKL